MYTFYLDELPVPVSVPPLEGMGVGVSLALRSILDLSEIDLIPVNNKTHNPSCIILKKISRYGKNHMLSPIKNNPKKNYFFD
jgi:hypothetical protein